MARRPLMTRAEVNAEGCDIVGLAPGQRFDPVGDLARLAAPVDASTVADLIDRVAAAAADRGFSASGMRAYLRGVAPKYPPHLAFAKTREAAEAAGYRVEVQP